MRAPIVCASVLVLVACAKGSTFNHGDTGVRDVGMPMDAPTTDAFVAPGVDAFVPGHDAFVAPGVDAFVPGNDAFVVPNDAHVSGTGAYLDRCASAGDCASGLCAQDRGSSHFCSRTCTGDGDCAHEHLCATTAGGRMCVPDDTGQPCSTSSPGTCAVGACLGSAAGGHCTHFCTSAADCAAGYACSHVAGDTHLVCIDIELPCGGAADCPGGYCTTFGCTAPCRGPSDCPGRFPATSSSPAFPAYACNTSLGSADPICIPPADIMGSAAIGAFCSATGTNTCRSDACDTDATPGPICTQACTAQGGCAVGLGCSPLADGSDIVLVCERAGLLGLTQTCAHGSDCASGLCDGSGAVGHCTRLCADGICPTGYTCQPIPGFGISLCRP